MRASLWILIEQDAVIRPDSPQNSEMAAEFAHFARASGYRCDSISALTPRPSGFTLARTRSTFRYAIKDKEVRCRRSKRHRNQKPDNPDPNNPNCSKHSRSNPA